MNIHHIPGRRGFVIELATVPAGFPESLQRRGIAGAAVRTDDGLYCEPRVPLGGVIAACESAGLVVGGIHAAGGAGEWHRSARPQSSAHRRLSDCHSATWLPTMPA